MEKAYDHVLDDDLRGKIVELVNDYFHFDRSERNTPTADDAIEYLAAFEKDASSFIGMLTDDLMDTTAASTRDVLRDYYWFDSDEPDADSFVKLAKTVKSLVAATQSLARDLNKEKAAAQGKRSRQGDPTHAEAARQVAPPPEDVDEGCGNSWAREKAVARKSRPSAWDRMIVDFTAAVSRFGLPASVNKGTDKLISVDSSAFTRFVMELQSAFPAEFRRHHAGRDGEPSYDATAGAIAAAQSAFKNYQKSRDVKSANDEN
jgi:hypothetical protein